MLDDLADFDRRITDALGVLRRARVLVVRAPTAETRWREALAERTLDRLLDRRPLCQMREQARLLAGDGALADRPFSSLSGEATAAVRRTLGAWVPTVPWR